MDTAAPLFEIRGAHTSGAPSTVLGTWTMTPAPPAPVSFDPTAIPLAEPTVWRVNLSDNAGAELASARQQLDRTDDALQHAAGRLDAFIQAERGGGVSFDITDTAQAQRPEIELRATLAALRAPVSFGILDLAGLDLGPALQQFQSFLNQLRDLLGDPLIVETLFEQQLAARTIVHWTGGLETCYAIGIGIGFRAQHLAALSLALRSRVTLLRLAALATQGAVRLAAVIAVPTSVFVMLPAIFKFISQVMDEFQKFRQQLQAPAQPG